MISKLDALEGTVLCMEKSADSIYDGETMSHEEIVLRFKKVFGRDMTAAERRSFFFDLPLSKEATDL